jgi:DNA-binding CsgD family transcriptional regulator/tetratricopeptide (TPR) repeat protein
MSDAAGVFVGRAWERGIVEAAVRAARDGTGRVLLIAGEPGVGKTRVAQWAASAAAAAGVRSGWGWASEDEGSPPYWPFRQAMRGIDGVGPVVFDVAAPDRRAESVAQERFRLFEEVAGALRAAAEPRGLLLVLDDMQWADPASLGLLVHLARGLADSRLFLLVNYRDTETSGTQPLLDALAALTREATVSRLHLQGLSEPEVAEQLADVTGWTMPGPVAAAVSARTRGNPFFVRELGRVLAASLDGTLPDSVRDAVRGRLAGLTAACRTLIAAAAALGSEFDSAALAGVTGRDLNRVFAALDEATAAGIIGPDLRFTHDLIREAARLEVPTATRSELHHAMAEYLAGLTDADRRAREIAHHRLEALPAGDPAVAVGAARQAAVEAMAHLAWEEADGLLARAIAGAPAPPEVRCELLIARAEAQVRAYDIEGSRSSLLAAAEIGRARGDGLAIARAVLTMEGVSDFTWDETWQSMRQEALAAIPPGDSGLRARLLAMLVVADMWHSPGDAKSRAAESLSMAERVGDRRAVVEALRASQIANSGPDGARLRKSLGDRLLTIGASGGDDDARLWGHLWRFDALAQLGDVDSAEAECDQVDAVAVRLRSPLARWHALRCRGTIAAARGRFTDALTIGRQAEAVARQSGHAGSLAPSLGFLVMVQAHLGHFDEIRDPALSFHAGSVVTAAMGAIQARWRLAVGDRAEAERLYRKLPPPTAIPPFLLLTTLAAMAELAAEFGDKPTAAQVHELLAPHADLFVCGGAGAILIEGSVRCALGIAAAATGRLDEAIRHLRSAADVNERAGLPGCAATARLQLARALRRRRPGDRDEAGALAVSAGAIASELGMVPLRAAADRFLAGLAGRGDSGLSQREAQVAAYVAQGLTNRQIAAAEHISERTVETHIRHIFTKLGLATRAQLAAWQAAGGERFRTAGQ